MTSSDQTASPDAHAGPPGPGDPVDDQQHALVEEVGDDHGASPGLTITRDDEAGLYDARIGGREIGGLTFSERDGRVVLVAVSVLPQFRGQGAATGLIRHALDDLRTRGRKATVLCPIVRTFIDRHPEYRDVVDPAHPGVVKVAPR